jgi:hypothetical protein
MLHGYCTVFAGPFCLTACLEKACILSMIKIKRLGNLDKKEQLHCLEKSEIPRILDDLHDTLVCTGGLIARYCYCTYVLSSSELSLHKAMSIIKLTFLNVWKRPVCLAPSRHWVFIEPAAQNFIVQSPHGRNSPSSRLLGGICLSDESKFHLPLLVSATCSLTRHRTPTPSPPTIRPRRAAPRRGGGGAVAKA